MNKKFYYFLFAAHIVFFAGCVTLFQEMNVTNPDFLSNTGVKKDFNPHEGDNCNVCHVATVKILNSPSPSKKEALSRQSMRTDLVRLCDDCHMASKWPHHLTGVKPKINIGDLPLDANGLITCATTCHRVHTTDPELSRGKLRHSFDILCYSCHDK